MEPGLQTDFPGGMRTSSTWSEEDTVLSSSTCIWFNTYAAKSVNKKISAQILSIWKISVHLSTAEVPQTDIDHAFSYVLIVYLQIIFASASKELSAHK
jgi:hypothetical protein